MSCAPTQGSEYDWLYPDGVQAAIINVPDLVIKGVRNIEEIRHGSECERFRAVLGENWLNSPGCWGRMLPL